MSEVILTTVLCMNKANIEVEIKCLANLQQINNLKEIITRYSKDSNGDGALLSLYENQINFYYQSKESGLDGELESLQNVVDLLPIPAEEKEKLNSITSKYSLRLRQTELNTIFICKATSNKNGSDHINNQAVRLEIEVKLPFEKLQELDQILLTNFTYQSKWSRQRETIKFEDITICIDKNAGYGYLVELEKMEENTENSTQTIEYLKEVAGKLGLELLADDRLERMFNFYNKNWETFYGTENTFTIY